MQSTSLGHIPPPIRQPILSSVGVYLLSPEIYEISHYKLYSKSSSFLIFFSTHIQQFNVCVVNIISHLIQYKVLKMKI